MADTETLPEGHLSLINSPNNEGYTWRKAHPSETERACNPYRPGTSAAEAWLAGALEAECEIKRGPWIVDPQAHLWPLPGVSA